MTPETALYLAKSRKLLHEADALLKIDLTNAAGRAAYLAAFHAAQALIAERTGRAVKTHKGVHTTFLRLVQAETPFDPEFKSFLSRSYDMKSIADYETGPDADVSMSQAEKAVGLAHRFVAHFGDILGRSGGS